MGAIHTKTDFQSLLVVSCLVFDLEHIIRAIANIIVKRQRTKYREIGCQTCNFNNNNLPDIAITSTKNNVSRYRALYQESYQ